MQPSHLLEIGAGRVVTYLEDYEFVLGDGRSEMRLGFARSERWITEIMINIMLWLPYPFHPVTIRTFAISPVHDLYDSVVRNIRLCIHKSMAPQQSEIARIDNGE